jgi:uncharacterized protein (DUF849 family)
VAQNCKVIITCAVTGAIHTPSMSEHLPITPEEIVEGALGLFGDQYRWSVLGAGASQMRIAAMAASMGGNVRVGLEDSLWAGPGKLAASNAEQVRLARSIIEGMGLEIATPDDAREILELKGAGRVNF